MIRRASTKSLLLFAALSLFAFAAAHASLGETSSLDLCNGAVQQQKAIGSHVANQTLGGPIVAPRAGTESTTVTSCPSPPQEASPANIFLPVVWIFNLVWGICARALALFHFLVWSPVAGTLSFVFNVFVYTPYSFFHGIFMAFYPLYVFCGFAAFVGFTIGGTAGWFSEVIVSVLTAPPRVHKNSGTRNKDEEYLRAMKRRRRAATLANLRAQNGGRLPEELYQRAMSHPSLHGFATPKGVASGTASGNISDASTYSAPRFGHKHSRSFVSSAAGSAYGD